MLLVEGSVSKCGCHRRRNQGASLESGSFSVDQFYESVVCMRLQSFIAAGADCGGREMWC